MAEGRREGEEEVKADEAAEPIPPEFVHEVVSKFCRDTASGAAVFEWRPSEWLPDAAHTIQKLGSELMSDINAYCSPKVSPEIRSSFEPNMFSAIHYLRLHGLIKDTVNKSKLEEEMETMDARFEAMRKLTMELLLVMREVLPKLEEIERKVDKLT